MRVDPPSERQQEPPGQAGPSRRLVIGLGVSGLLVLLTGGFVAGSLFGPEDRGAIGATPPSDSASQTPTVSPPISPTPTADATTTAPPSLPPVLTPAGPPQDIAVGAWATVAVEELNVRSAAGTDASSNYLLVRGAVVHVAEGPAIVAGMNWFRVTSVGGAVGWVASGSMAEPFLTTLVEDPILIRCGEVEREVFDIVSGVPTPDDPVAIGDFSLPAAAFSDFSLGAMELLRGVGNEACFSAQLGSDGTPAMTTQLSVSACGRAVRDDGFFQLRPAAGQTVPSEMQVKDPVVVHPALLASTLPGDPMAANLRNVVDLMAAADTTGCIHVSVQEGEDGVHQSISIDASGCFVAREHADDGITLVAAAGGDSKRVLVSEGSVAPSHLAMGVPVFLGVSAGSAEAGSHAYVHLLGFDEDCKWPDVAAGSRQ